MSKQRDAFRDPPGRKLALSGLISRTMAIAAEREQQRSKLVNAIILAQFLVTAITTVGYIGSPTALPSLAIGIVALAIYVGAFITNRMFHRGTAAAYILVIGGSLAIAGQTVLLALNSEPLQAGQAALLFIAIILEAGLFFAPEITLLIAFATTIFSAFAILLGLANDRVIEHHDAYLLMAFTLGLQALTSLIAWLLSQYIYETTLETQRAQDLQFAQARYEALAAQMNDHQAVLDESIGVMMQTITQAITGEGMARAAVLDSELSPLAESLNLLLERFEIASQAEQARSRMDAAALPMIDAIARMSDVTTPTPSSLPIMTNTPLDSVSVMLGQMSSNLAARMGRVQHLAGEVARTLSHSQEVLGEASDAVHEAQRIAGLLISTSGTVGDMTRKQLVQITTMRRMLKPLLPDEITRLPENEAMRGTTGNLNSEIGDLSGLAQDLGMGSTGYTGQFDAIAAPNDSDPAANSDEITIAPMTLQLQTISADGAVEESAPVLAFQGADALGKNGDKTSRTSSGGELLPELVETWNQTTLLDRELGQLERALSQIGREVGVQSKQLRTADVNIAWIRSALEAVYRSAEQLEQIAATSAQAGESSPVPSRPLPQMPRGPQMTRPIPPEWKGDDNTLAELAQQAVDAPPTLRYSAGAPDDEENMEHEAGSLRTSDLLSFSDDKNFSFFADVKSEQFDDEQEEL